MKQTKTKRNGHDVKQIENNANKKYELEWKLKVAKTERNEMKNNEKKAQLASLDRPSSGVHATQLHIHHMVFFDRVILFTSCKSVKYITLFTKPYSNNKFLLLR